MMTISVTISFLLLHKLFKKFVQHKNDERFLLETTNIWESTKMLTKVTHLLYYWKSWHLFRDQSNFFNIRTTYIGYEMEWSFTIWWMFIVMYSCVNMGNIFWTYLYFICNFMYVKWEMHLNLLYLHSEFAKERKSCEMHWNLSSTLYYYRILNFFQFIWHNKKLIYF